MNALKIAAVAVLALILSACAGTPSYMHSEDTHRNAVEAQLPPVSVGVYRPTLVEFSVGQDGRITRISATAERRGDRSRAIAFIEQAGPFPPHNALGPLEYSATFPRP